MAFAVQGQDEAINNKQHLNLSMTAYDVVQNDMFAFNEEKLSGFINRIFENYYPEANASISRTLNKLYGNLSKLFLNIRGDEKTKDVTIKTMLESRKKEIETKNASYENGKSFKFWLNTKNLCYLTETDSECEEDLYYSSRGKYIKCVIEEYSRLSYIEREKIYYNNWVKSINEAIKSENQLRIATKDNKIYSVYPYDLLCDPLSTANYLIGYCKRYGFAEDELKPCSFRLSALDAVKVEKSKSAFLKASERTNLAKVIASRGVQFMVGKEAEILVKLTEEGLRKYQRQSHLRPILVEKKSDNVFLFQCTTAQAEFYFFKFGKDAEILSPSFLRSKFFEMYLAAQNAYNDKEAP